jgi:maleylacetoacetate isomerase
MTTTDDERLKSMKLHNYWRSSTSYRARIVLNLKELDYEYVAYHLRLGEQRGARYLGLNRQGLVPSLELDDGHLLTQSLAIIEYLEEVHPQPPLLPADPLERARGRALAHAVALDLHPINNLRILTNQKDNCGQDDEGVGRWFRHWVDECFRPLEADLSSHPQTGVYCHGDRPTLADVTLVPQIFNARRFDCRLDHVPTVMKIFEACMLLPAFDKTQPSACPDAA